MNRILGGLVAVAFLLSATVSAQTVKKQSTITGEVIDIVSYMSSGMKPNNEDRKAVAEASVKAGNPLGILEKGTGKIYIIAMQQTGTSPAETLRPYFGLKIFATGKIYKKGGLQLFLLTDIGKSVK